MNAWSHLPNAAHIDRVLQSVKAHPEVWDATQDIDSDPNRSAIFWKSYILLSKFDAPAWFAANNEIPEESAAIRVAVRGAILALFTYNDSAKYLGMTPDQLKTWAILSEEPAAVLLLPAVLAYEKINQLELV